ncbi:unnamed protein product [Ilex paraguariensis]|uniref:Uncharacterized protein n=1 Tax=Ilex paraguariensis TaxID=185542 RepID=A0ABC8T5M0_9AQUA
MDSVHEIKDRKRCAERSEEIEIRARARIRQTPIVSGGNTTSAKTTTQIAETKNSRGKFSIDVMPKEVIEQLRSLNSWDEWPCPWTYDEEQMRLAPIWYPYMDVELSQLHAENEEIVWDDDVWDLKDIKEIPEK